MTIPTLRWPDAAHALSPACRNCGMHNTPTRCWNCGSGLIYPDPPHGLRKTGDATCGFCSRVVCNYEAESVTPAETDWVQDEPPKRGRPPKKIHYGAAQRAANAAYRERLKAGLVQRERWATDWDCCISCHTTNRSHHGRGLCYGCRDRSPERERARQRRAGVAP